MSNQSVTLEKLVSLCKRRGFLYPTADLYGGINGLYDAGNYGVLLKEKIKKAWRTHIKKQGHDIVLFDGAILGPQSVWEASGHIANFHDPMVDCKTCKKRYRADEVDVKKACPHCGNTDWTEVRDFNLMFATQLGATQGATAYLRPETAQAIFANFKNMVTTQRVKIPFGVAQIGKAFRNEITPKQFLFRMREFEQMELEFFCKPAQAEFFFTEWLAARTKFYDYIGINPERIRLRPHGTDELSHYSTMTSDVEYHFPFGWKELEGIAYRGNYDLSQHMKHANKDMSLHDDQTNESYVPHVVECSVGVDRLLLTTLFDGYAEELIEGELRTVLRLHPRIAPITAAIFPLTKEQIPEARQLYQLLIDRGYDVEYDASGSIGKRYRRQDEIGTPRCITVDFESTPTQSVTVRDRDTMAQKRISRSQVEAYIQELLGK